MLDIIKHIEVGDEKYPIAFTLNVMEAIQDKYGSLEAWGKVLQPEKGEPKIKDLKWTFTQFINEGIDIENEEKNEKRDFITEKQAGRIISVIGMEKITDTIFKTSIESINVGEEKNRITKQKQME